MTQEDDNSDDELVVVSDHEMMLDSAMGTQQEWRKYARFFLAALGGLPWIGGVLAATAALRAEQEQGTVNEFLREWVASHEDLLRELQETVAHITSRLDELGPDAQTRAESDDYGVLVRKGFRVWGTSDTKDKRRLVVNLLTNAAGTSLCSDDQVRLFIEWIDHYHETHFKVIAAIYQQPGSTRGEIWRRIGGEPVREDSAEADLFRLLIRDLSTGGVIRQARETDANGAFLKRRAPKRRSPPRTMESAFEDTKPYVLTSFGEQFVHYTMNDFIRRISG